MNKAQSVNEACIAAAEECPQSRLFDDFHEFVDGKTLTVDELHKKGLAAVIGYWRNPDTIGGDLLWNKEYYNALPNDIQEMFDNIDRVVDCAIKSFCEKAGV